MASGNKVKVNIIDQNGKSCDTSFFVASGTHDPADAGVQAVITALQALITGGATQNQLEVLDNAPAAGTGTAGGYNAADKVRMIARSTVDGADTIIEVPCPATVDSTAAPLFNLDGSVNQSCPAIAALITFINTYGLDTNGNPLYWVSGRRSRAEGLKTAY